MSDLCGSCGAAVTVGEWPWCPHGVPRNYTVVGDELVGGEFCENVSKEGETFYSKSEKRRYLAAHGMEEHVRHIPEQGSDKSPHTQRWV